MLGPGRGQGAGQEASPAEPRQEGVRPRPTALLVSGAIMLPPPAQERKQLLPAHRAQGLILLSGRPHLCLLSRAYHGCWIPHFLLSRTRTTGGTCLKHLEANTQGNSFCGPLGWPTTAHTPSSIFSWPSHLDDTMETSVAVGNSIL